MPKVTRPQRTLARETVVAGVGYLSGSNVSVRFRPARPGTGVEFVRVDLPDQPSVPAHIRHVVPRERRTAIQRGEAVVEMVEHVMAALAGLRIDNCRVEIDAPETPGCDGSSRAFVEALTRAGTVEQAAPREVFVIGRPITTRQGNARLSARPGEMERLVLSYDLDYGPSSPIGRQSLSVEITPESFQSELAASRTFLLADEADALKRSGIGAHATEADLLVFGPEGVVGNSLRFPDECVRHKVLDLLGDLSLLGKDVAGHISARRSGHSLNAELVRELLAEAERDGSTPDPTRHASLDIRGVMGVLPHRYPFLLIDRVLEIQGERRVLALKNVTCNEPFFAGHWPGRPVMPGVLILEALAQAAGILIAQWTDPASHVAMIVGIDAVKIRRAVVPGDQLYLEAVSKRVRSRMTDMLCTAKVGDQVAAEASIRFVILPLESAA